MYKFELARKYYVHYGNLEIPRNFKTIDGITYDEKGIALGDWIWHQRKAYEGNKLTEEQRRLLESIGIHIEIRDQRWNRRYELTKKYYDHYRNSDILSRIDGMIYAVNGIAICDWLELQRKDYNKLTEEQIILLDYINVCVEFSKYEQEWNKKYELAKKYYEHYGNLEIPARFKTLDGITYDENGVPLGEWLIVQRLAFQKKILVKLTKERIELLESIGMQFQANKHEWNKKYELAKKYYEHYGNLEIPTSFKTLDGITYDENGVPLGKWLAMQRHAFQINNLLSERVKLLGSIGMRFSIRNKEQEWDRKYELAKKYYEYYGNLEIPQNFKTIDGINYDENGTALGTWIVRQRQAYYDKGTNKITEKQIKLLDDIGMRFETNKYEQEWNKKYELAKKYYEHYGNLRIPRNFKTIDGITYDDNGVLLGIWIDTQRKAFNGKGTTKLSNEQIKLLDDIGMRWMQGKVDDKLQAEEIYDNNKKRKDNEILNRVSSFLNLYRNKSINKEDINKEFLDKLNHKR